jgi:hypothetical protein
MTPVEHHGSSALEIALRLRQFEIELFWRRALFFWGFIAAAFVGLVSTYSSHPRLSLAVSCFGTVCALCWTLVNRGSKYWYETWEIKVNRVGGPDIEELFLKRERVPCHGLWSAKRFSVSRVLTGLSDFTLVLWVGILAYQVITWASEAQWSLWRDWVAAAFCVFTLFYVFLIIRQGRSRPENEPASAAPDHINSAHAGLPPKQ